MLKAAVIAACLVNLKAAVIIACLVNLKVAVIVSRLDNFELLILKKTHHTKSNTLSPIFSSKRLSTWPDRTVMKISAVAEILHSTR